MDSRVKMVKKVQEGMDISFFLSEAVFSNIISWLPVEEAVRTSVLVKYWKHAWKYVTRLDLDPESICKPARHSMEDLINCTRLYTSIIQSIQNEVTHCQLVYFPTNVDRGELTTWVEELLMRKKVKELSLKCFDYLNRGRRYYITSLVSSPGVFSPLEVLELTGYRLSNISPFHSCEKLRVLKLSWLELDSKYITEIFSFCKSLEEFSLLHCHGFSELEISSQNLKFLELRCLNIRNINISAEALTTLILYDIICKWSSVIIDAPRVTELQAFCSVEGASLENRKRFLCPEELLERCTCFLSCNEYPHSLYISQRGYVSAFHNLQVLSTSLDLNDIRHAILLSYILRVCSQLKRLDITVQVRDRCKIGKLNYPEHLFWEKKDSFDCITNSMRAVSIQNFKGEVLEMEFVRYIITRAPRMHRVTVKCAHDCTTEEVTAAWRLLSFPKSSLNVSVAIVPHSPQQEN